MTVAQLIEALRQLPNQEAEVKAVVYGEMDDVNQLDYIDYDNQVILES